MSWRFAPPSQPHRNVQMWLFNYRAPYCLVADEDPEIFGRRDVYRAMRLNWKNVNWLWLNKYHCWAFVLPKQPYLSSVMEKGVKTESFPNLSSLPFYVGNKLHIILTTALFLCEVCSLCLPGTLWPAFCGWNKTCRVQSCGLCFGVTTKEREASD